MSGHSKWATIKRKKGAVDAKRGALFTKIIREITVAAKAGGDDLNANPRLRTAVAKAKANNMPNDNVERAIKKGTGTLDGVVYEEIQYEGYGPGGVAILVNCLTDNRNRTTAEVRATFSKNGGNLGETGCVAYLFERKGMMVLEAGQATEDEIIELLMDYNIEDIRTEDDTIQVVTPPEGYNTVHDVISEKGYRMVVDEITFLPQTTVSLDEKKASQCLRLIETLEDLDDIQDVYSNYDISDDLMMKISEAQ
ncbi:MAG: YebC/PmpR family DNA-binding transcriptional regulator [Chrysiogenales bacterium]|nr:MAG: YebC/PmpR family DNA-binding transcriptional regulator [Chrysiogenales bacterium]